MCSSDLAPTLFEVARDQLGLPASEAVFIANNDFLEGVSTSLAPGYGDGAEWVEVMAPSGDRPVNSDYPVFDELLARIAENPPRLAVVNLHDVDRAGHFGEGDAYIEGVSDIDDALADFWTTLQRDYPSYAANLLTVVVADHGRHRHDEDNGWHNHGDSCTGCREIPLMLLGPTIQGQELEVTVTTEDVPATVAAWLRLDMATTGLPVAEAFEDLDVTPRSGVLDVVTEGGHDIAVRLADDRDSRSTVEVDGTALSTPGIFAAEGPALLAATDGLRACFRELDLSEDDGYWRWVPRCLAESGGEWDEMGFPDDEVGAFWKASLAERDGITWVAWPQNRRETGETGKDGDPVTTSLAAWDPDTGWTEPFRASTLFPAHVTLVATDGGLVLAEAASHTAGDARYSRRARVVAFALDGLTPTVAATEDFAPTDLFGDELRVERPALGVDGATVRLAALVSTPDGTGIFTASSTDGGLTWGGEAATVPAGDVLPDVTPVWDGDVLMWARRSDADVEICRGSGEIGRAHV